MSDTCGLFDSYGLLHFTRRRRHAASFPQTHETSEEQLDQSNRPHRAQDGEVDGRYNPTLNKTLIYLFFCRAPPADL